MEKCLRNRVTVTLHRTHPSSYCTYAHTSTDTYTNSHPPLSLWNILTQASKANHFQRKIWLTYCARSPEKRENKRPRPLNDNIQSMSMAVLQPKATNWMLNADMTWTIIIRYGVAQSCYHCCSMWGSRSTKQNNVIQWPSVPECPRLTTSSTAHAFLG